MLVKCFGSAIYGIDAHLVTIEVSLSGGMAFVIVGLPDNAVKESRDRVMTAIRHNRFDFPRGKIVVNMAPADIKKEGSAYDLPIALSILAASHQVNASQLDQYLIMGELSLDGEVAPIRGALPIAMKAKEMGFSGILLPAMNAKEAAIVQGLDVIPVENLKSAVHFLNGDLEIMPLRRNPDDFFRQTEALQFNDFAEVKGQLRVKRALEVAAAGGHNIIMIGPPGAGKTMLARRISGILPSLTLEEALETTKIHSVSGSLDSKTSIIAQRPFRSPHHTISDVALVGGGGVPQPGEISLAHNGILFLDELPEFKRTVLEVLRQPLEERQVTVSRARISVDFPASFMLVASMNPCPCGYYNHPEKDCICSPQQIHRYLGKISGPLLDRIDLHIEVTPVDFEELSGKASGEKSTDVRKRVEEARKWQQKRYQKLAGIYNNAMMPAGIVRKICEIDPAGQELMKVAIDKLGLSARAYDRILKVSRTIADLEGEENILPEHVGEAIQYRSLDREGWAG